MCSTLIKIEDSEKGLLYIVSSHIEAFYENTDYKPEYKKYKTKVFLTSGKYFDIGLTVKELEKQISGARLWKKRNIIK